MKVRMRWATAAALCASTLAMAAAASPAGDETVEASPRERADAQTLKRFFDDALHSSNLRLRVMAGRMPDAREDVVPGTTWTPIDELAELARGSTDPMVLALLIDPCGNGRLKPVPTCDALDLAKRWTLVDTQNQLSWLTLSSVLHLRGDLPGSRAAFERASTASMWHEYFDEGSRVFASAVPKGLGGQARLATLELGQSISATALVPFDAMSVLNFHCKDATLRDACVRIVETVARDSGSLFSSQLSLSIGKRVGIEPSTIASRTRALDALRGTWLGKPQTDEAQIVDAAELAEAVARAERRIEAGELATLRQALVESGLTESASASRYRQYVAALVRQAGTAAAAN